jgi:hypothetical protein
VHDWEAGTIESAKNAIAVEPCPDGWSKSVVHSEVTFHQIAPYIGKLKSSIAHSLIEAFTRKGQTIYDPFCGAGTIAFEAWLSGRNCVANDLSVYACLITKAKLFPPASLEQALKRLSQTGYEAVQRLPRIHLDAVPPEVSAFFHPQTLREILAWVAAAINRNDNFLLASLLGILHHQRPGFLSFPSSHTVPYLRKKLFPSERFPQLYNYRTVQDRLERKVRRSFKRVAELDRRLIRKCYCKDASRLVPTIPVDAIITSPPYMRQLDYGRDNRLRLWFLGISDWLSLDKQISPREDNFLKVMADSLELWKTVLKRGKYCILVLGDTISRRFRKPLPAVILDIALQTVGGYELVKQVSSVIPEQRRVRRNHRGSRMEIVLVLRRT